MSTVSNKRKKKGKVEKDSEVVTFGDDYDKDFFGSYFSSNSGIVNRQWTIDNNSEIIECNEETAKKGVKKYERRKNSRTNKKNNNYEDDCEEEEKEYIRFTPKPQKKRKPENPEELCGLTSETDESVVNSPNQINNLFSPPRSPGSVSSISSNNSMVCKGDIGCFLCDFYSYREKELIIGPIGVLLTMIKDYYGKDYCSLESLCMQLSHFYMTRIYPQATRRGIRIPVMNASDFEYHFYYHVRYCPEVFITTSFDIWSKIFMELANNSVYTTKDTVTGRKKTGFNHENINSAGKIQLILQKLQKEKPADMSFGEMNAYSFSPKASVINSGLTLRQNYIEYYNAYEGDVQ